MSISISIGHQPINKNQFLPIMNFKTANRECHFKLKTAKIQYPDKKHGEDFFSAHNSIHLSTYCCHVLGIEINSNRNEQSYHPCLLAWDPSMCTAPKSWSAGTLCQGTSLGLCLLGWDKSMCKGPQACCWCGSPWKLNLFLKM